MNFSLAMLHVLRDPTLNKFPDLQLVLKRIHSRKPVKGVVDDEESEAVTECKECEEQLCSSNTTSVANLIKGINHELSNIMRVILRN